MAFLAESGDRKYFFMDRYLGSNRHLKAWVYTGVDSLATVMAAGYFDDWSGQDPVPGDIICVYQVTDRNDLSTALNVEYLIVVEWNAVYKRLTGNVANVDNFGAVGDGVEDDTVPIQYCLDNFRYTRLREDGTYKITRSLTITNSNRHLLGNDATIYMPAASFDNTTDTFTNSDAAGFHINGLTSSPFTAIEKVSIRNLTLESEVQDGRKVDGIVVRNVNNFRAVEVEMFGFPVAKGFRVDSVTKGRFIDCFIHDFTSDDDTFPPDPQITGIHIDDNRVNSVASTGIIIDKCRIKDLTVGAAFLAEYGDYQTDGINANASGTQAKIRDCEISGVGEGIDWFGADTQITGCTITDCEQFCIALKHTTSQTTVDNNILRGAKINHIYVGVGNTQSLDGIKILGNTCIGITEAGSNLRGCLRIDEDVSGFKINNTLIANNRFDPQPLGEYAVHVLTTGTRNDFVMNEMFAGTVGTFLDTGGQVRTHIPARVDEGWFLQAFDAGVNRMLLGLQNKSGDTNTEVALDLNPSSQLAGVRSAQVTARNLGSNDIALVLRSSGNSGAAPVDRMIVRNGVQVGAPTGGDKGAGHINVQESLWLAGVRVLSGSGDPNSQVTADPGALYLNTAGGAGATVWVKESGSATDTGWVAK